MPPPNRAFVGRVDELGALAQALARTGRSAVTQPQAVIGLGGIGKTQLALAYAYAYLSDYDLIRWLRAEEPATLAADYVALAPALGLDPATPDQAVLLDAVRARLEGRDRYLLVFDNATDPASLGPYLPRIGKGHVLITSRHRHWEGTAEALEVEVLPEADAVALLLGGDAANPLRRAEAEALARKLGYLPLALAQARAFMREHGLNIPAYRRRLESVRPRVMAWRPENAPYSLPVAQVWQASLDQVARDCPVAPTLNQLLAFFAPDAIPRDLLGADPGALPDGLREELDRDKAIAALGRLSLLRVDPNTGTLGVHRLVQAVTLDGLDEATAKARAEQTVRLVNAGLPRPAWEYDHQSIIRMLLAHALSTVSEAERLAVGLDAAGEVLLQVGMYLAARASFIEAEQLYRRAIAAFEKNPGTEHPGLGLSLSVLANLCRDTGRRAEAEPLYERAIAIGEKTLGSDSRELAIRLYNVPGDLELFRRLHNFALLYHQDGRRAEAEPLYERAITVLRKILASLEDVLDRQEPPKPIELMGYPEPASLLGYMGIIYYDAGRPLEAEPFLKRAVEIDGQLHGPVRVGVGSRCYKLGKLYYDTGRYAEAEPLLRRALKIGEKGLGPEHPLLSTNLDTLAALYRDTGRLAEAERLEERTAAIKRRAATAGRPPP